MSELPKWPEKPPIFHEVGELDDEKGSPSCSVCHGYDRDRAEAAIARLRVAVKLLESVECGSADWCDDRDEAIAAIGPIPEDL